mgnify:CR=1 FL=1
MKKWNKYKCTYINWWWTTYEHWVFEVLQEGKIKFKMKRIETLWFPSWIDEKKEDWFYYITIDRELKRSRIKEWEAQEAMNKNGIDNGDEKEFVVYCSRQWVPYIFTKI